MRKEKFTQILLVVIFVTFSYLYYSAPIFIPQIDKVYITVTTFFFSIFTGFFISQQFSRYSKIREIVGAFDGKMSNIYRSSGNIDVELQKEIGKVIEKHYKKLLASKEWDYHFTHKSETLHTIHTILEKKIGNKALKSLRVNSLARVIGSLADCEAARKSMVMLYQERIPTFQWFIITFFVIILLSAISAIPSSGLILESVLKSAYGVSIFSVISILYHLDSLHLFEDFIGENSAKDVLNIIKGKN